MQDFTVSFFQHTLPLIYQGQYICLTYFVTKHSHTSHFQFFYAKFPLHTFTCTFSLATFLPSVTQLSHHCSLHSTLLLSCVTIKNNKNTYTKSKTKGHICHFVSVLRAFQLVAYGKKQEDEHEVEVEQAEGDSK